jgi:membrane protein
MKQPLRRFWDLVKSGELQLVAGALSFSTILSVIPFLAVALAMIQYMGGFEAIYPKVEAVILQYFQGPTGKEGSQIVAKLFRRVQTSRMGGWGAFGLILASTVLLNDMERGIHRIWNMADRRRPVYQRFFFYCLFLVLFPVGLAMYVALSSLSIFSGTSAMVSVIWMNWFVTFLSLFLVYKMVPNIKVDFSAAALGAISGTAGLVVLYRSFKWISQSFFGWGKMYGSFAAVPALLIWVLLTWYVILIGAAVTASFRK